MNTRKKLIIGSAILIAWILATILILKLFPRFSEKPVNSTGAILEESPNEDSNSINLLFQLKTKTPVKESGFELTTDYKQNKLVVTLTPPYEDSKKKFLQWIQNNDYQSLPKDDFVFYVK